MADLKISALTGATTPLAGTEVLPIVQSSTTVKVAVSNLTAGRAVSMLSGTATDFLLVGNSAGAKYARIQSTGNGAQVNLDIFGKTGGGADAGFAIGIGVTGDKGLEFQDNATGVVRVELAQAGNLKLNSGNLVIGTDGKGIDFSVTSSGTGTMTSELFADYEEGTFTAGIAFGGAAVGVTYDTTPTCTYTKIGRQVTVTGRVGLSSKGSSTGDATITGLPFTSANTGNAGYGANSIAMNLVTFANQYVLYTVPNSTSLGLYENTILGVQSSITNADFDNSSNLLFTSTYFV